MNYNELDHKTAEGKARDAEHAEKQIRHMMQHHKEDIANSIRNTRLYDVSNTNDNKRKKSFLSSMLSEQRVSVVDQDSVTAVLENKGKGRTCVLNFADYLVPGGTFLTGADYAQEEALCHESDLFPVISSFDDWYQGHINTIRDHLYTDQALYSKDIFFERDGESAYADVLTCAAPNLAMSTRDYYEKNFVIEARIHFIMQILMTEQPDTAILGAFGCGAFGNSPERVARQFRKWIWIMNPEFEIIFAIPGGDNFEIFKYMFH